MLGDIVAVTTLVVTLILALLTGWYVWLTQGLLRAQTDAHVIVYPRFVGTRAPAIELVIENLGNGVARDIKFELSEDIPYQLSGWGKAPAQGVKLLKDGPLIEGMPFLAPRASRTFDWGDHPALHETLGKRVILVTCVFKSGRRTLKTLSSLEVASFEHQCYLDSDGARQCAKELSRILEVLRGRGPIG